MSDYVLVPREATEEMKRAGSNRVVRGVRFTEAETTDAWAAMLMARPSHCDDLLKAMEECERAFESADEKDWLRLHQILGYSAHGKFWRGVLIDKLKPALSRLSSLRSEKAK